MNNIALTIIMPTWNKVRYIAQAIDSILAQKTKFRYHVIIADDHSTDGTLEVVTKYMSEHPGMFTLLKSETNQKLYKNVIRAYAITKTPYFCVLDPDDYWISDRHIEKALSYLSSHPDYTIYSTEIQTLGRCGEIGKCGFPKKPVDSNFNDYLEGKSVIAFTQSCVYRNVVFSNGLPERLITYESPTKEKTLRADSFRNFLHIREGKSHYVPDVDSCYRLTDEGIFAGTVEVSRQLLNASLFADLWRYDDCRHIELLQTSRRLFTLVRDSLLKEWSMENYPYDKKCLSEIKEFVELSNLYKENSIALNRCLSERLPLKKRIYLWAALKLQKKGLI